MRVGSANDDGPRQLAEARRSGSRVRRAVLALIPRAPLVAFLLAAVSAMGEETPRPAPAAAPAAEEGVAAFLTEEQAPAAVFPGADQFERRDVPVTAELRAAVQGRLGEARTSLWEPTWITWQVERGGQLVGYAVVVEEVGKHRPITSVVGVTPDGRVKDLAVMVYREAYGGEVGQRRFLAQYAGASAADPLAGKIRNVAGATLSVDAMNRGVQKALAIVDVLWLHPSAEAGPSRSPSPAPAP